MNIDGNLSDWLATDRIDRGLGAGYEIYAKSDGADFTFALKAPLAIGANTTVWLNTDRNVATGHQIFGFAGGAEFNVNVAADGTVSLFSGNAGQTLISSGLTAAWSTDRTVLEFSVPKAAIGNPRAIDILADVNDAVFLPGSFSGPGFTVFNDTGIIDAADHRIAIVYSETTAANYFSETAYSQLFMAAQSQAMQSGIPFDLLTEADLTNLATLAKYDTIVFPSFRNVQASQVTAITQTLEQATRQFGVGLVTGGEFMTNDANNAALAGDSYSRMKLLFDVTRVTGGTGDVTVRSSDAANLVLDNFANGETIRQYTGIGWNAFTSVSGSGTTIATSTVGGQTYAAGIATQTVGQNGGRNVIFSTEGIPVDSNLLWQAIDYSVNGAGPSVGLQITRQTAVVAARNDMDQSMYKADVQPSSGAPGIYDKMLPILDKWKADFNFVGSYYVNVGGDAAAGQGTDWALSARYYKALLDMGNELGTHSFSHPVNTNLLNQAQIDFEFGQSKAIIEQQMSAFLGRAFTVTGAAVPGAPEQLATSQAILASGNKGMVMTGPNLVANGDFSAGTASWTNSAGLVEVGSFTRYAITSANAGNVLELDADAGSAIDAVSQTIATQAGQSYSFAFDIAQRGGTASATNTVQVLWNGTVIDTVTPTSTNFANKSYTVTAAGATSTITFRELAGSDSLGGIIDNVSLTRATPSSPFAYLTGGYAGVGAGYVSGSGFLKPGSDQVYIAPNTSFDFTLIGFQGKTVAQAEAAWAAEWSALTSKGEAPVVVWPWHDYGPTMWDIDGLGLPSKYTEAMFTNFIARAYTSGAEFVTLEDLAQRTQSFAKSTVTSTVSGNVITATVSSGDAGRFALDVDGQGRNVIKNVEGWYAYDADSVFMPANGGTFKITLGAAQDDVTRITALPMRASLLSVSGDGRNIAFSASGEGKVLIDLAASAEWVSVTGATITSRVGELLTLNLGANTNHTVNVISSANARPIITSTGGVRTMPEFTTAVTTVVATDANTAQGDTLRYSLDPAERDSALFQINAVTGALSFRSAPDFSRPLDSNGDNIYNAAIIVTDSLGARATQTLSVQVTNTNVAPVLTLNGGSTLSLSVAENTSAVVTLTATDANTARGDTLRYAISGGPDAALFSINPTTGALTFRTAPDFETPIDNNRNNYYDLVVAVNDARGLVDTQTVVVRVTDVAGVTWNGDAAGNNYTGTNENDKINGAGGRDTLRGGLGNDIITGGSDGDFLFGGAGNDTFRFTAVSESWGTGTGRDIINDFVRGQDRIDLSAIDANTSLPAFGNQAFTLVNNASSTFSGPAQIGYSFTQIGGLDYTIVQGNVDIFGGADFSIAVLGRHAFTAADFVL